MMYFYPQIKTFTMKKIALFLLIFAVLACETDKKNLPTVLTLNLQNNQATKAVVRGSDFEQTIAIPSGEIKVSDTLDIKYNGYYDLYLNREKTTMYLEKGSDVFVNINADEFHQSITYTKELAGENNYLAKKFLLDGQKLNYQALYRADENDFLTGINLHKNVYDSLMTEYTIENKDFIASEKKEIRYAHATALTNYQEYHRYFMNDKDFTVSEEFYNSIKDLKFDDTTAFRNSVAYQQLLNAHFSRLAAERAEKQEEYNQAIGYLTEVDNGLPDGYAKNKLMANYLEFGLRPDESLEQTYAIYKESNPDKESLEKITARYDQLKDLTKGNPSPTFNYENHEGGTTSLADLKGQYVYMDIWATWCGPCIAEIPSLKLVEEEYAAKNIKFVSISIDTPEDYEKWKQFVKERNLGGMQLMADNNWESKFIKDYGVIGIPRFILVDPEGKIVTADAPRPSDEKLRKILDELI